MHRQGVHQCLQRDFAQNAALGSGLTDRAFCPFDRFVQNARHAINEFA
jgi:hypothetical protein